MSLSPTVKHEKQIRPKGEVFVWLTAMGLVTGLVMIIGLMGFIATKGLEVFWPRPVTLFELRAGSPQIRGPLPQIAGELITTREKVVHLLDLEGKPVTAGEESQVFIGNKDAYGNGFIYLDCGDILRESRPENIIVAERVEYGDSIFEPVSLQMADGLKVPVSDPKFDTFFHRLVEDAAERRAQILVVEKDQIGRINADMEQNARRLRVLEGEKASAEAVAELKADQEKLQARYEILAKKARELRDRQKVVTLTYRIPSGQERTEAVDNIIDFYYPNRLGFWGKTGVFLGNIKTFVTEEPREANTEGGIFPAIFGTLVMTVLMSAAVMPIGVFAAIYLREYAKQGPIVRLVRISINNLAGVPSIVFGVVGLGFFVYIAGGSIDKWFFSDALPTPTFGTGGILWASLTLAVMTLPVVIVATEEALSAVPRGVREASLACGASKWQTIQRIVLPASAPGILTGLILAMARGAGEVAPLMLVGVVKMAPTLPLDTIAPFIHPERKFMHLGFHIYDLGFQSPDSEAAKPMVFATTLLLVLLVVVLNLGAIHIRNTLRKKYATSAF